MDTNCSIIVEFRHRSWALSPQSLNCPDNCNPPRCVGFALLTPRHTAVGLASLFASLIWTNTPKWLCLSTKQAKILQQQLHTAVLCLHSLPFIALCWSVFCSLSFPSKRLALIRYRVLAMAYCHSEERTHQHKGWLLIVSIFLVQRQHKYMALIFQNFPLQYGANFNINNLRWMYFTNST